MDTEARKAAVRSLIKAVIEDGKDIEAAATAIVEAWEEDVFNDLRNAYNSGWHSGYGSGYEYWKGRVA